MWTSRKSLWYVHSIKVNSGFVWVFHSCNFIFKGLEKLHVHVCGIVLGQKFS